MSLTVECCSLAELGAILRINGNIKKEDDGETNITITTENAALSRRIFSQIRNIYYVNTEVSIRRSNRFKRHVSYILRIPRSSGAIKILDSINIVFDSNKNEWNIENFKFNNKKNTEDICCKRAYLRGAFLAGGSISDPDKTYHLEISTHSLKLANELKTLLQEFDLNAKVISRKGNYITYLKEGQNIVDFLNVVGAHKALLELENIRILKEMRNNVNRIVNCETANLEKTVNASVRQVDNIRYLRDTIGFDNIPRNLKEIAEIRLEYTDANLKELGKMLSPPLGKSGVNHRLRKLDKLAEDIRDMRG